MANNGIKGDGKKPPRLMPSVKHNDSYKRNPGETQLENKAEMSAIFKEMALTLFRVPEAMPSSEAAHATLLLTHVAWSQALGGTFTCSCSRTNKYYKHINSKKVSIKLHLG